MTVLWTWQGRGRASVAGVELKGVEHARDRSGWAVAVPVVNKISMSKICLYNFSYKKVTEYLQQPVTTEGIRL